MRKLLFVMDTFPLGGIAKSLLNLFNEIDENKYEIDLLLFKQEGIFINHIPKNVNLVNEVLELEMRDPHPRNLINNIYALSIDKFIKWIWLTVGCTYYRLTDGISGQIRFLDTSIAKMSKTIDKQYDVAIAYQGGRCIYYIIEKINAKVKIGYVHSDYSKSFHDYILKKTDKKYFHRLDYLVTISELCKKSLINEFPEMSEKIYVIENICSPKTIYLMSKRAQTFPDKAKHIRIATMCRIDIESKGLDYIVDTCLLLLKNEINFKWYLIGDGVDRVKLEHMISKNNLQGIMIILGAFANPYGFINDADIYVQPSRYEGKSVALDEVKALRKPIIVTNFSTVRDQFENEVNALIVNMIPQDICDAVMRLIADENLRKTLINNLTNEHVGNEEQVLIFENLLDKGVLQ